MKNYVIAALYGLMIIFISCEEDAPESEQIDQALIENRVFARNSRENKGFSIEKMNVADFPKSDADFIIIPQTNLTGDVVSPFLSNPNLEKRFILSNEFGDIESAQAYFNSYSDYPVGQDLQQFALEIKPNQVWLVKTHSGTFCKILIMDTRIDKTTSFVEIKFRAEKIF